MGYTHYWSLNPKANKENYQEACEAMAKIVEEGKNKNVLAGWDGTGKPKTKNGISFNGVEDESHESFVIPKAPKDLLKGSYVQTDEKGFVFTFCKTARKDYDDYVVACLAVMKHFLLDDVKISSDGYPANFSVGTDLASKILGLEIAIPITEEEDEF